MKMILAAVTFATLLTPAVLAQSQSNEAPPSSAIYLHQAKPWGVNDRDDYLPMQSKPAPNANPREKWPCDTAPDFCPGFYGDRD